MKNLSLYIHIPFCATKCGYCDFFSVKYDAPLADRYLSALEREIGLCRKENLFNDETKLATLYIGGGTPSVFSCAQLHALCALIKKFFSLAPDCEWTVECNPESFSPDKAGLFLEQGVTRLSFGFQSLVEEELLILGRVHGAERCREILRDSTLSQFSSIGVDLMYGLPSQTTSSPEQTVSAVAASPLVKHVSAYELTIADGTPFGRRKSRLSLPGDDALAAMTDRLWTLLAQAGFEQYEVSNFAKPGHRCCHNEAYWDHKPWLGLGPAAHSYLPPYRWANVRDIEQYCSMVEAGIVPREFVETIDAKKAAFEMVFLGLRRTDGINENEFQEKSGIFFADFVDKEKIEGFLKAGLLSYDKPFWKPTRRGLLMADAMARGLV